MVWATPDNPSAAYVLAKTALTRSYYDFALIVTIAALVAGGRFVFARSRRVAFCLTAAFYILSVVVLWLSITNIRATLLIGGPITYQWLYYADFAQSFTSQNVIISTVNPWFLSLFILVPLAVFIGANLVGKLIARVGQRPSLQLVASSLLIVAIIVSYFGYGNGKARALKHGEVANAFVELLRTSIVQGSENLSKFPSAFTSSDFLIAAERDVQENAPRVAPPATPTPPVTNVLIVVLESVGARYLYSKIGNDFAMPHLNARRSMSMAFMNFYSHAPLSNKSLFALLTGIYPRISYRYETEAYIDMPLDVLSQEFRSRGYKTGFFMSGDFQFQRVDRFLQNRGFDKLADIRTIPCKRVYNTSDTEWRFSNSVDDACTTQAFKQWLDETSEPQPFFAILWTGNTHWPYSFDDNEKDYGVSNKFLNRYANSLRASDQSIENALAYLTGRNLLASTLVVILGDHGQAFNQHGNFLHGETIYDEEIHIPLLLMNPKLLHGQENNTVGGIIDVAPTILDLLRWPAPKTWQGRSLFDSNRSGRVYFFVPTRDMMLGFRDAGRKYLLNLTRDKLEVFDLISDPAEQSDIISRVPESAAVAKGRLAAWVQYQEKLFGQLARKPP
jgi:arylsulfatase A-like enzyme